MTKKKKDFLAYTVLFLILAVMMVAVFAFKGKSFIHTGDPFDQDYPIFLYLGRCLQGIIKGENIHLYDFSIGLGENVIAPLNLYGFGDPLNLLSIFVSQSNAENLYTFLLFTRLYLSGLGMLAFLRHHNHQGCLAVGGALSYAFSMFSIIRGFHFYSLLSAMYLFPFLLIQLELLIKGKKQYGVAAKFALLIAIQTCCSFYFLYMQTIFLVIYATFFYRWTYGKKIFWRHLVGKIAEIGAYYLVGVLTSGVILFPTLREFFHSSRTAGGLAQKSRLFFSLKELSASFSNALIPMTNDDNYGLAIPCLCLMAVIIYLLGFKQCLKGKVLICALVTAYICPFFWSMTNGFSYESDRWTYVLYFGVAYITVVVLEEYIRNGLPRKHVVGAILFALLSVGYHLVLNMDKIRSVAYFIIILACGGALIKFRLKERQLMVGIFACVFVNIFFLVAPWQLCGHDIWKSYCDKKDIESLTARIEMDDNKTEFERIDIKSASRADSLAAGYMGTTEYFSILNENTYRFWEQLLISPGICAEPHHLEGLDGRKTLEALLGVKKYQDGNQIVDNEFMLPLGVQYDQTVSYAEFAEMSPLQRQHILLEKIVLEEGMENEQTSDWEPLEVNFEIYWENIEKEDQVFTPESDARIILKINGQNINSNEGELYVYFSEFRCYKDDFAAIDVGGHELLVQNIESKYYTGLKDYLVHVTTPETDEIVISFPQGNQYELNDIAVFWYDYEGTQKAIETLEENSLQNIVIENDRILGDIEAKDGWLFLSIPYSSDWKARVDGEKVEICRANVGFMAIYLEGGRHFVELEYKPNSFLIGVICTSIGITVILCLFTNKFLRRRKKRLDTVV